MRNVFAMSTLAAAVMLIGCETGPDAAARDVAAIDAPPPEPAVIPPEQVDWQPAPPVLEEGAELAVVEGNPEEAGPFTVRMRMPDGYRIAPHWHPHVERVTVLEGTLHLGIGEQFDADATEPLATGSYFYLPPELPHFVIAEDETVIQVSGDGPFDAVYVDPDDDPRN